MSSTAAGRQQRSASCAHLVSISALVEPVSAPNHGQGDSGPSVARTPPLPSAFGRTSAMLAFAAAAANSVDKSKHSFTPRVGGALPGVSSGRDEESSPPLPRVPAHVPPAKRRGPRPGPRGPARVFDCPHCPQRFDRASQLDTHMRRHLGIKPFACDQCQKSFVQRGDLKRHLLTHTSLKPFACHLCPVRCRLRSTLARHVMTHTGERPHKCEWPGCDYSAIQKHDLTTHMRRHTQEKPFRCDINGCSKTFGHRKNLVLHQAKYHQRGVAPADQEAASV